MRLIVVGGGIAGLFAAISAAETAGPSLEVMVLEREETFASSLRRKRANAAITKVVAGDELLNGYPRGGDVLCNLFPAWSPSDTIRWLKKHGVEIEIRNGSAYPASGYEQRYPDVLVDRARKLGVRLVNQRSVVEATASAAGYRLWMKEGPSEEAELLILATGGRQGGFGFGIAQHFGHEVDPPLPAYLNLKTRDARLKKLQQVEIADAAVKVSELGLSARGPISVLAKGIGGAAINTLTSIGAQAMKERDHVFLLEVDWVPEVGAGQVVRNLRAVQESHPKRIVSDDPQFELPVALWQRLVKGAKLAEGAKWSALNPSQLQSLASQVCSSRFKIDGFSPERSEMASMGGVKLQQVDPGTLQSLRQPHLFFVGDMLDMDGLPGGYHQQLSWTTGRIAGLSAAECSKT